MNRTIQNILFIELLGGIGDGLIALPAIQALGRTYPTARLTILTFAPVAELLCSDPLIHTIITVDRSSTHQSQPVRKAVEVVLEDHSFDLIVSDTNYDGIAQLIQSRRALWTITNLWQSPPSDQRVGGRFLEILLMEKVISAESITSPQLYLTATEIQQAQQILHHCPSPLIVLIPDAGMVIKRWPPANFGILGQMLQQQYDATVVIPVGENPATATQIASLIGSNVRIWPRGSLRELAALLAIADLAIASDTGPARIAAALNTPTITLFGPSWHERYGQPAPHINLQGYSDCPERDVRNFTTQRCWYGGECPFDRWHTCLEDITPDTVFAAAVPFLTAATLLSPDRCSNAQRPHCQIHHGIRTSVS